MKQNVLLKEPALETADSLHMVTSLCTANHPSLHASRKRLVGGTRKPYVWRDHLPRRHAPDSPKVMNLQCPHPPRTPAAASYWPERIDTLFQTTQYLSYLNAHCPNIWE